jgi:hypothetical protein
MAKVLEIRTEPAIYSIPLDQAVYCENCNTISNSRPYRCGVCCSEAVLRVEPILNRDPDPPGGALFPSSSLGSAQSGPSGLAFNRQLTATATLRHKI